MKILRPLIDERDEEGILRAEEAIETYIASFPAVTARIEGLIILQLKLVELYGSERSSADKFLALIERYVRQRRAFIEGL